MREDSHLLSIFVPSFPCSDLLLFATISRCDKGPRSKERRKAIPALRTSARLLIRSNVMDVTALSSSHKLPRRRICREYISDSGATIQTTTLHRELPPSLQTHTLPMAFWPQKLRKFCDMHTVRALCKSAKFQLNNLQVTAAMHLP